MKQLYLFFIWLLQWLFAMSLSFQTFAQTLETDKTLSYVKFADFEYELPSSHEQFSIKMLLKRNEASANLMVDSSKIQGQRVSTIMPTFGDWDGHLEEQINELEKGPLDEIWCTDFLAFVGNDVTEVSRNASQIVYTFSPVPGPDGDEEDAEFLSHMQAYLTIDAQNGALRKFEMKSKESFRPVLIAKIKTFQMQAQCSIFDNRAYVKKVSTHVVGSVGFKDFEDYESSEILQIDRLD